jgi:hypothetical protein
MMADRIWLAGVFEMAAEYLHYTLIKLMSPPENPRW